MAYFSMFLYAKTHHDFPDYPIEHILKHGLLKELFLSLNENLFQMIETKNYINAKN